MASGLGRARRLLRSPRVAAWLLVWLTFYVVVSTAVPQAAQVTQSELARWQELNPLATEFTSRLGLHSAFSSLLFLAPALLLTVSTAVCAWDRSRSGAVFLVLRKRTPRNMLDRLGRGPSFSVGVAEADPNTALDDALVALRSLRLHVVRRDDALVATTNLYAGLGSALFHWALVALFLAAGLGQLVKWEGRMGIPVGHSLTDTAASYGVLTRGPWAAKSPSTGYTINVAAMDIDYVSDGAERGHAPLVRLLDGETVIAERLVYPNSPLHHGSLYIHRDDWGLGVVASLETSSGDEVGRQHFLLDFDSSKDGRIAVETDVPFELGAERVVLELPLDEAYEGGYLADLPSDPRVEVRALGSSDATASVLRAGDVLSYPGATMRLRIVDVTRYTRLFLVDDPTIPWVYAFLVLAMLGCVIALLGRPRAVLVRAEALEGGGVRLHALVVAKRVDPLFKERVREALFSLSSSPEAEGES